MKLFKTSLALSSFVLCACSAEVTGTSGKLDLTELQHQWVLTAINNAPVDKKIKSTLNVDAQSKSTGNLACNQFFGGLELQDNEIRIDKMGSTRKMCQESVNVVEHTVSSVLANWSQVQLSNGLLILNGKKDKLSYRIKE